MTPHISEAPLETAGKEPGGIAELYTRLREMILAGVYPPGMLLPQRELARTLGVSRTPLREVLRLLQAEGLIEAGHYQRSQVAAFEPEALDALYASRIQLETLGIALSVAQFQQHDLDELSRLLETMRGIHVLEAWEEPHHQLHNLLVAYAGRHLLTTITGYAERSERYVRIYGRLDPNARSASMLDHELIVQACIERNEEAAMQRMALHLTRTAVTVLAQMAPEYEPVAVRKALQLVRANQPLTATSSKPHKAHQPERRSTTTH